MDINAALTLVSFLSFLALLVGWLAAPLRADSAASLSTLDAAPPAAVAA